MGTSQPKVIPLVAKGLNAGKYPGVCVLACINVAEGGWLPMGGEGDLEVLAGGQVLCPLDYEIEVEQ